MQQKHRASLHCMEHANALLFYVCRKMHGKREGLTQMYFAYCQPKHTQGDFGVDEGLMREEGAKHQYCQVAGVSVEDAKDATGRAQDNAVAKETFEFVNQWGKGAGKKLAVS